MRHLLAGGQPNMARKVFDDLYEHALKDGRLPAFDGAVKSLPANEAGSWGQVLLNAAIKRCAKGHPEDVLFLARQCQLLAEPDLMRKLLTQHELDFRSAPAFVRIEAVKFMLNAASATETQRLLNGLLENARLAQI